MHSNKQIANTSNWTEVGFGMEKLQTFYVVSYSEM
jgi:hypothetical protein